MINITVGHKKTAVVLMMEQRPLALSYSVKKRFAISELEPDL